MGLAGAAVGLEWPGESRAAVAAVPESAVALGQAAPPWVTVALLRPVPVAEVWAVLQRVRLAPPTHQKQCQSPVLPLPARPGAAPVGPVQGTRCRSRIDERALIPGLPMPQGQGASVCAKQSDAARLPRTPWGGAILDRRGGTCKFNTRPNAMLERHRPTPTCANYTPVGAKKS
jgi:hypothetical protein